jgi:hypothetical protein
MHLAHVDPVDAVVKGRQMTIQGSGSLTFLFSAPGLDESAFQPARWSLPGLTVKVAGAPAGFRAARHPDGMEVVYDPGAGQAIELKLSVGLKHPSSPAANQNIPVEVHY